MHVGYHGYQSMLHKDRSYSADTSPFLTAHDPQMKRIVIYAKNETHIHLQFVFTPEINCSTVGDF